MKEEEKYLTAKYSKSSYERLKCLVDILKEDFEYGMLYIYCDKREATCKVLNIFNEIFEYISWLNHIHQDDKVYHFYCMHQYNETDDDFYKHLIDFGGYNQVLVQGNDILNAEIIVLDNSNENHIILCYNEMHKYEAYDILDETINMMKNDYCDEYNDEVNEIIDKGLDKLDIDYAEM